MIGRIINNAKINKMLGLKNLLLYIMATIDGYIRQKASSHDN